jgi:hypothetical protein
LYVNRFLPLLEILNIGCSTFSKPHRTIIFITSNKKAPQKPAALVWVFEKV